MPVNEEIFSQKALDRLKRPRKTGRLFAITSHTAWIALAAVAVSIFSILIWSVFGIMAEKVSGYGIILNKNGLTTIEAASGGKILKMNLKIGQKVLEGETVAVLDQSALEQEMYLQADQAQDAASHEDLHARTSQLSSAKERFQREAFVVSSYSGEIISQRQRVGDIISVGTPLYDVRLDSRDKDLIAVMYVPALTGSKIKRGTTIQISPGAVDSTLYGSLVGRVTTISDYPVTSERIVYWTGNREFASWVVQKCGGAIMEVLVELIHDEATPSGYLWTTINGSGESVSAGMTCTATAIVRREAPLVKAFDKLSQWVRSD